MASWTAGFTQLTAWEVAFEVGDEVLSLAARFPHPFLFSLGSQMMRAALSVPVNIAEGYGRRHSKDKARFYEIAHASGDELKCLLLFARKRKLMTEDVFQSLMERLDRACRLVHGLMASMDAR